LPDRPQDIAQVTDTQNTLPNRESFMKLLSLTHTFQRCWGGCGREKLREPTETLRKMTICDNAYMLLFAGYFDSGRDWDTDRARQV
jgi:hypothetical protein